MQCAQVLIDCSTTSLSLAPSLRKWLAIADKLAYVTTLGLNGQLLAYTSESQKMASTVWYMEHISPVQQCDVLAVPVQAYDLVLRLPWLQSRYPDDIWQHSQILALQTPRGADVVAVDQVDHVVCHGNVPGPAAN
jgi:hypothetical protein